MKEYPSIVGSISTDFPIYAWDKLDGSNIRSEWTKKKGFNKFGTRERLLDYTDPIFGKAPSLILDKYDTALSKIFRDKKWEKVTCFFEYYGLESFAGHHNLEKPMTVTLFDIYLENQGFLESRDFLKIFGNIEIPALCYTGKANSILINSVKNSSLSNMTFEGVVCKGPMKSPGYPWMFKIKSNQWLERLKNKCGTDLSLFEKLK